MKGTGQARYSFSIILYVSPEVSLWELKASMALTDSGRMTGNSDLIVAALSDQ
jgi:hypothetical protein